MSERNGGAETASRQLASWKEIAAYLQRDIRTVQRWEKKEGLPVRRHVHESRSSVSASAEELDAWVVQRTVVGRTSPEAARPWWKNWRSWVAAAIACAGLAVMVAFGWMIPVKKEVVLRRLDLPDMGQPGIPSWDGRFISYWSGHRELFLYDTSTAKSHLLYRLPKDTAPSYSSASPDGSQAVFPLIFRQGGGELRLARSDGSSRVLLPYPAIPCGWSSDGGKILMVLPTPKQKDLVMVEVATGMQRVVHSTALALGSAGFSPDGRFIAFTEEDHIYVMPAEGGNAVAITSGPARDVLVGWTPDGRVVFKSDRSGKPDVWAVPWDGKAGEARILWKNLEMDPVGTTKQGDLYAWQASIQESLVAAELVNGRLVADPSALPGTRFEYGNRAPDFSPDGASLAYVSAEAIDGKDLVLRIRALANNQERVIRPPMRRVDQIRWYRDGKSILIQGGDDAAYGFYKVALAAEGSRVAVVEPILEDLQGIDGRNPTFSLDGRSLYFQDRSCDPGTVDRLDLETGRRTRVLEVSGVCLRMFALSPDQRQIAYATQVGSRAGSGQVFLRGLSGGAPRLIHKGAEFRPGGTLIWPGSDAILLHRASTRPLRDTLMRVPLDGSEPSDLASSGAIRRPTLHPDGRRLVWEADTLGRELSVIEGLLAQ